MKHTRNRTGNAEYAQPVSSLQLKVMAKDKPAVVSYAHSKGMSQQRLGIEALNHMMRADGLPGIDHVSERASS